MTDETKFEIQKFIEANPEIERIEAIFPTINGIYRGKWVPAEDHEKLSNGTLRLPISTYALDCWGIDVEAAGLGIVSGDPDGIGIPVPKSIAKVPWAQIPSAQILMTMHQRDSENTPCPIDPRQQLSAMAGKFNERSLTPIIATELEFYLLRNSDDIRPQPYAPITTGNLNDLDQMIEFEPVLEAIKKACDEQRVLADVMIAEAGMCQFEINFKHVDDALRAADQAMLFKRIVKGCAKMHGMRASFMAKPFGDDLGSGMHAHISILDDQGNNIFDQTNSDSPATNLLNATGGLLSSMRELQAVFAPNLNSFRRFQPGSFAPNKVNWGMDHRGVAVRLPEISGKSARLEHRICGADVNPYLALTAILGGILHGLDAKTDPGAALTGQSKMHHDWTSCISDFEHSALAKEIFGETFHTVYSTLRHHEAAKFATLISDVELELFL